VESIVNANARVIESAAVGVADDIKGEALVVFARVAEGLTGGGDELVAEELRRQISEDIGRQLGKPLTPRSVHLVHVLPKTRSGKILRRMIKAVYTGENSGDTSSLDDPAALDAIRVLQ
jgi:acetyl-CoA synthetase